MLVTKKKKKPGDMIYLLPVTHNNGNTQSQGVVKISVLQVKEGEMMDILSKKNILSGTGDMII